MESAVVRCDTLKVNWKFYAVEGVNLPKIDKFIPLIKDFVGLSV